MEAAIVTTRRQVWDGALPVKFYSASEPDKCCFLMLKRCSYLPLATATVRRHLLGATAITTEPSSMRSPSSSHSIPSSSIAPTFSNSTSRQEFTGSDLDIFYSYRGLPLKWHYPIGLLYDLLSDGSAEMLPWGIAVHFYDPFPVQTIIRMLTHDSPRETFMATVKQADYIRCGGSSRSYMAMLSKSDQSRLWDGLWSDNFERFWQANSKLLQQQRQAFNIPLRIYQTPLIDSAMNWPPPIQELVSSTRTDGKETTVGDLLESVTPVEKRPAAAAAVLHGVEIPLETPLCWLSENCAYADGFLHVVLR